MVIATEGDIIRYSFGDNESYPDYVRGKTFESKVLLVYLEIECYGVYAEYGQDLIPFYECEIITK